MLTALFVSFGVVFIAEFGDKSQLLTLTLATKYRAVPVLIAITGATMVLQAISVGIGGALGASLPTTFINALAAVAFLGFAIWTLRDADDEEDAETSPTFTPRRVIFSIATMFFLAELGDKTMLSSMTLATDRDLFGTWLGATLGMVAADGLALLLGKFLGDKIPRKAIRYGSAAVFFLFAMAMFVEVLR
jgi:putative Ca2+/H+ antiporter (TMEM165/GDT1 family)